MDNANRDGLVAIPRVRLAMDDELTLVVPEAGDTFAPFPLPPMAASRVNWLMGLGETWLARTDRCISVMLMIDLRDEAWALRIPEQQCSNDGSRWFATWPAESHAHAKVRLAGSFQMLALANYEDVYDAAPPHDGLHIIRDIYASSVDTAAVVRINGEAHRVELADVLDDDWGELLMSHQQWLRID